MIIRASRPCVRSFHANSGCQLARAYLHQKPYTNPRPRAPRSSTSGRPDPKSTPTQPGPNALVSKALSDADLSSNSLLAPVHVPEAANSVLKSDHPATSILSNSAIVIQRQLEMMNVMLGFEQANRYVILDPQGNHLGFMAERDQGVGNMMARQLAQTHRAFTTHVFDRDGKEVLRFQRPFSWISSRIRVYDALEPGSHAISSSTGLQTVSPGALSTNVNEAQLQASPLEVDQMRVIGEAQQQWAPLRRRYNLFVHNQHDSPTPEDGLQVSSQKALPSGSYDQFAHVNERFLSWDFSLMSQDSKLIGSVNRNFAGFGREIFTDTGVYALRMDAAGLAEEPSHLVSQTGKSESIYGDAGGGMSLDQRAVMLATAVSVDFDYFSPRRSGVFGGMWPMWLAGGAPAAEGAGAGEAAGAAGGMTGVAEEAGEMARGVGGVGAREGAAAGAGTMAGYEAMQRGSQGGPQHDPQSPQAPGDQGMPSGRADAQSQQGEEDVWGQGSDPWSKSDGGSDAGSGGGGGSDGGGLDFGDWF